MMTHSGASSKLGPSQVTEGISHFIPFPRMLLATGEESILSPQGHCMLVDSPTLTWSERSLLEAAFQARLSQFRLLRVEYGYITDLPHRTVLAGEGTLEMAVRGLLHKRLVREVAKDGAHWCFAVTAAGADAVAAGRFAAAV